MLAYLFAPNFWSALILLAIVLLLFGNRLPSIARSFGQSITEFKRGMRELEDKSNDDPANRDR